MIDTRISIGQQIIFNNTGLEWHKLQYPIADYCSTTMVHCITTKFYDTLPPRISTVIDGVGIDIWLRFSVEHLHIEAICIKNNAINEAEIEETE